MLTCPIYIQYFVKVFLSMYLYVLGAFGPCPVLYDGMEIKHIMNDTLGYV